MKKIALLFYLILAVFLFSIFILCSKSGTESEKPPLEDIIEDGWSYFSGSEYSNAINKFNSAIEYYGSQAFEAYNGRGWSYARIAFGSEDDNYNKSMSDFEKALSYDPDLTDAKAGVSFVYLVLNYYSKAANTAESVLNDFPNYSFKYDSEITAVDLRVLLAQAFFYLGNYSKAANQLDIIEPGVNHPADNYDILLSQIQSISFNF